LVRHYRGNMGVFEQLVPLIRFGQLLGVVPYSLETDPMTRKFKRVTVFLV